MDAVSQGCARFHRTRSVSLSGDAECVRGNNAVNTVKYTGRKSSDYWSTKERWATRSSFHHEFSRTLSSNCIDRYRALFGAGGDRKFIEQIILSGEDGEIHINWLPDECLERVFQFLTVTERGIASQVCMDWHRIMRNPSLWSVVDLTSFPTCSGNGERQHQCTYLCYAGYRHRLKHFLEFLISVRPVIRTFKFALDIDDPADGYRCLLSELLRVGRCQELTVAELVWTETPAKRPYAWQPVSATWSTSDMRDLMFKRHHRQRHFVRFFDLFTATVPNLVVLSLPFDWSERSLLLLTRLSNLRDVTLTKYYRYAPVTAELFTAAFASLPRLRRLSVQLWTESSGGFSYFELKSSTLEHLDVSACRGIFISEMSLPSLITYQMARSPLIHALDRSIWVNGLRDTPCVYDILCRGAPRLRWLNSHCLQPDWHENAADDGDLQQVLANVCSCAEHKAMTNGDALVDG